MIQNIIALDRYLLCMLIYGVNIQEGQSLLILVNRSEAKIALRLKELARSHRSGSVEILFYQDFKTWTQEELILKAQSNCAFLKLNLFERFVGEKNQALLMDEFSVWMKGLSTYSQHGLIQSCSSVIPSASWAKLVFPDSSQEEAIARLTQQLVVASRCDNDHYLDSCKNHYDDLSLEVCDLNQKRIQKLTFKSMNCDLVIGLNEDHVWVGSQQVSKGIAYLPNFPTQEVFTANSKHQIDGWFQITRPFRYKDQLISDLKAEIKEGAVIGLHSDQNIDAFRDDVFAEKSRRYFGEIALVDQDNPIAKLKSIFNCVLLDENAVCHIALGSSYPVCSNNYEKDLETDCVNKSDMHLDMMIGSDDLIIKAFDGQQWFMVNR